MTELKKATFTLHRYFMWANRMRTHFEEKATLVVQQMETGPQPWTNESIEAFMYMSYWYGGLYVVVEGWRELKITDTTIDKLVGMSKNIALLKKYRNGVFHYQKNYFDDRFMELLAEGEKVVDWVRRLNEAFGAYFFTYYMDWELEKAKPKP